MPAFRKILDQILGIEFLTVAQKACLYIVNDELQEVLAYPLRCLATIADWMVFGGEAGKIKTEHHRHTNENYLQIMLSPGNVKMS